jgi:tRNA-dihydrouridine synthase A
MAEPETVAACVSAMSRRVDLPISVKTRIGIDRLDGYDSLKRFVSVVAEAGCDTFIVHARKAWLKGLSPKQNRDVPPLCYDIVYRLKRDFPHLEIVINGGITTLPEALGHLDHVDGVMLGREVYHDPYIIADVDRLFFADPITPKSRREILELFRPYMESNISRGVPLAQLVRHIMGLYHGMPGARRWRRILSEQAHQSATGMEIIEQAIGHMVDPGAGVRVS